LAELESGCRILRGVKIEGRAVALKPGPELQDALVKDFGVHSEGLFVVALIKPETGGPICLGASAQASPTEDA